MIHKINFFEFLFILSVANIAVISAENVPDNCTSSGVICNDLELARDCGDYDWCKSQSVACGSISRIKEGAKPIFGKILTDMNYLCTGNYEPFKKLYGQPDILSMKLDVQAGRLPFTLNFQFAGYPGSTSPDARLKIRLNEKEIYNTLDKSVS